jgi:hypothetical protein
MPGGLFKSSSPPPVTLPPPPPQMPVDSAASNAAYRGQAERNAGLASTIDTSPQGVLAPGQTTKSLLGS